MTQAIRADQSSNVVTTAPARTSGADGAGDFDRALEAAFGRGAALGGASETALAKPQVSPGAAQETPSTRKPSVEKSRPKDLTQLSEAELSGLPDATGAARAELAGADAPASVPAAPKANGETGERAGPGDGAAGRANQKNDDGAVRVAAESKAGTQDEPRQQPAAAPRAGGQNVPSSRQTDVTAKEAASREKPDAVTADGVATAGASSTASQAPSVTAPTPSVVAAANAPQADKPEPGTAAAPIGAVKTISGAKSKALLASLESSTRGKFVVEDDEPLTQVSRGLSLALKQGGRATLRLSPEALGELTVHLEVKGDQVAARLEPTTDSARHLLEARSHELWAALEARGLSVERIEIDGSRIGQQFGSLTQDAGGGPDERTERGRKRRDNGAEPRAIDGDGLGAEPGLAGATLQPSRLGRWRLDAIA